MRDSRTLCVLSTANNQLNNKRSKEKNKTLHDTGVHLNDYICRPAAEYFPAAAKQTGRHAHRNRRDLLFFMSPFVLLLLDCELHLLYSALVNIAENKAVVQFFTLRHRLQDVGHLALGQYVLEKEGRVSTWHKAYLISKR